MGKRTQETLSFIYWDTVGSGANPIAPFQLVCLADSSEVSAAASAGVRDAVEGRVIVPAPTGTVLGVTMNTRRILGVTLGSAWNGDEVTVVTDGVAEVMVNAAVACGALVFAVARATRTNKQTPFTNLFDGLLPVDPKLTVTYQLALGDDPSPTWSSTGGNALVYPVGMAMRAATAQYDVIPVLLGTAPFVG